MEPLSKEELACLRSLTEGGVHRAADCRPGVLLRLHRLGLVVQRPLLWLPFENMAHEYSLSPAGQQLLERLKSRQ